MTLFFALYLCLLYFIYPTIYGRRAQGTGGGGRADAAEQRVASERSRHRAGASDRTATSWTPSNPASSDNIK